MAILESIRTLDELSLENQRVFVRTDAAAPAPGLEALALGRLLPTLEHALGKGARVVVAAHLPSGEEPKSTKSLESFGARLSEATGWEVFLPDDCLSDAAKRVIMDLRSNQICLLENLMFHAEESHGDAAFARSLAAFADVYVNDAFAASRQRFASLTSLPRLIRNRGAGLALAKEVEILERVKNQEQGSVVYLLGGSPTSDRLDRLEALLTRAGTIVLGAELGRSFLAARNAAAPAQATEKILARVRSLLDLGEGKLVLPRDFSVRGAHHGDDMVVKPAGLTTASELLDVGPESVSAMQAEVKKATSAILNGKLHASPDAPAGSSTLAMCEAIQTVEVGVIVGSDAVLALKDTHPDLENQVGHISMDEAAAFDWLAGKRFFGIESLTGADNE